MSDIPQPNLQNDEARAVGVERSIPVQLLILAGPMIGAMMSRTVMSFVDFAMVSQLGAEAQAAIMPAGILLFCVIGFGMGLVTAVNTYVSQSLGRNRPRECSIYNWQGFYLSLAMGVACLPCWWFVPTLFSWFGHDEQVQALEVAYTQIGLFGIAPGIAAMSLSNFFNGIHRPIIGFVATVIGNLFNILANYVLIFGNWGFEPMGISGASLATVLASVLSVSVMIGWLATPHYRNMFGSFKTLRPSLRHLKDLLRTGTPSGLHFLSDIFSWMIFTNVIVGRFGTVHLAANNTAFKYMELSFMPAVGLSGALTAAVGRCIGQRRHDNARKFVMAGFCITMSYMGLVGIAMFVLRYPLMQILTSDDEVVYWGTRVLICAAVFQVFDAMNLTFGGALRGAGDTTFPAVASFVISVFVLLGGSFFIAHRWPELGSIGPWIAATLNCVLIGLALMARYYLGPWERLNLIED